MNPIMLRRLRQFHLYVAVFFAPAIIFFAFSGILQTDGFHEARGGAAQPPAWIKVIASLHQHQRLRRPERPRPPVATPGIQPGGRDAGPQRGRDAAPPKEAGSTTALMLFTALMGFGLVVASLLGIAVALGTRSTRRVSIAMLVVGLLLPVALIAI